MVAGQKAAAPEARVEGLGLGVGAFAVEDDEGGEVFVNIWQLLIRLSRSRYGPGPWLGSGSGSGRAWLGRS